MYHSVVMYILLLVRTKRIKSGYCGTWDFTIHNIVRSLLDVVLQVSDVKAMINC